MSMRWCRLYKGTPAELSLEDAIAELGVPYRTQFPGFMYGVRFFPDFYLPTLGIVIEVDDRSHDEPEKQEADAERTRVLEREWGVRVLRCRNEEALSDPRGTLRAMLRSIGLWPLPERRRVASSLPAPRKAPQKQARDARLSGVRQRRGRRANAVSEPPKPSRP